MGVLKTLTVSVSGTFGWLGLYRLIQNCMNYAVVFYSEF